MADSELSAEFKAMAGIPAGAVPSVPYPRWPVRLPPLQAMNGFPSLAGLDPGPPPAQVNEAGLDTTITVSPEAVNRYAYMTSRSTDDPLILDKGWGVLREQLTFAFISAPTRLKKYTSFYKTPTISPGVYGTAASLKVHGQASYDRSCKVADFCRYVLDNLYDEQTGERQDLRQALWHVADAWHFGYSVTEIEYRKIRGGEYNKMRGVARFVPRMPQNIRFRLDPYSNRVMDVLNFTPTIGYQMYLPVRKFLIYTYQPFGGLPYGMGDGRVNHKHLWQVSDLMRLWTMALQKHGGGSLLVKDPVGTTAHLQQVHDMMVKMTASGLIVVPKGYEVEPIALPQNVLEPFMKAIEWHTSQCALNILGQKLTTQEGTGKGTFALASIHADTQEYFVNHVRKDIESLIRYQLLARLVEMNFGEEDMKFVPLFSLGVWNHNDTKVIADYVTALIGSGVVHPSEPWIKDRLEVPASLIDMPTVASPDGLVLTPERAREIIQLAGQKQAANAPSGSDD